MSDRTKQILLIIAFILITILIAVAIYYVFFRPVFFPPAPAPVTPTPTPTLPPISLINITPPPAIINALPGLTNEIPSVPAAGITPGPEISYVATGGLTAFQTLEANQTQNLNLATNGQNINYYDTVSGSFYTITPDGQKQLLSDISFRNVSDVTWSPNSQKVVLEYPDGSNTIFNFATKKNITLPSQWADFSFSNDSQQIVFKDLRVDPENRYLGIANTDGSGFKKIENLGNNADKVYVDWAPNDQYVALYSESIDGDRADVYPIGLNNENFRKFRVEGRDLRFNWTPSGNKLLYSVYNSRSEYKPALYVVNTSPDLLATGRYKIDVETWADKCTLADENTAYCAVPQNLEQGDGFRPDLADNTSDNLYKINLQNGSKELIAEPIYPTTIDQLIISQDSKYLYWLEKNTGQIKKLNL